MAKVWVRVGLEVAYAGPALWIELLDLRAVGPASWFVEFDWGRALDSEEEVVWVAVLDSVSWLGLA